MPTDLAHHPSTRAHWRDYLTLCKPNVVGLIVFTAVVGMLLAPGEAGALRLVAATLGIALLAASAAAINHVADHRIDALMDRTRDRPLPSGGLTHGQALAFAAVLGVVGTGLLVGLVNVLTAVLTLATLVGYALVYTLYLKRATPQNIVIGGAAGAAPPVLGWSAVTGTVDGHALLLFLIIFAWTPPHFWALAIHRCRDYARADVPMLPVTHGVDYTRRQVLLYAVLTTAATLMPYATYMAGPPYLVAALALNAPWLYLAARLQRPEDARAPMRLFGYSIVYLAGIFAALLADHWVGPWAGA